jgi:dTDP-4-amino-4,6-dideoxygalactose transaminase
MPSLEEYINEIKDIWESHWLTNNGKKHNLLENELKDYLNNKLN